jgi:hypothetical protein
MLAACGIHNNKNLNNRKQLPSLRTTWQISIINRGTSLLRRLNIYAVSVPYSTDSKVQKGVFTLEYNVNFDYQRETCTAPRPSCQATCLARTQSEAGGHFGLVRVALHSSSDHHQPTCQTSNHAIEAHEESQRMLPSWLLV